MSARCCHRDLRDPRPWKDTPPCGDTAVVELVVTSGSGRSHSIERYPYCGAHNPDGPDMPFTGRDQWGATFNEHIRSLV